MDGSTSLTKVAEQNKHGEHRASTPTPSTFSPGFTWGEMSWLLAFGVPLLYFLMALIEGSSYVWRPIAIVLYVILLFIALIIIVIFRDVDGGKEKNDDIETMI